MDMKKIISIILPFFVCCSIWFGGTVSAAKQAVVSVAEAAGEPGGIVEVDINISDNPGITYLKLKINYDGSKLSLLSAENTDLLAGMMFMTSQTVEVNPYVLQWASAAATNGGGTIAKLKFQVKDGAAAGDSNLEVTYTESYDEAIQVVNIVAQNGKIAIGGGGGTSAPTSAPQPTAGANTPAPTGGESGQTSGATGGAATAGQNTGSAPGTDPQPTGSGQTGGAQQADPTGSSQTGAPSGSSSGTPSKAGSSDDKGGPSKLWLLLLLLIPAAAAVIYMVYRRKKPAGSGRS